MAHQVVVTEEHYVFKSQTKNLLYIVLGVGLLFFVVGLFMAMSGGGHDEHGAGHASLQNSELVATAQQHAAASEGHVAEGAHHETAT